MQFISKLKNSNENIFILVDTRFGPKQEKDFEKLWDRPIFFNSFNSNQRGLMLLFRDALPAKNIVIENRIKGACRQGDPISGYLFILVMEVLALLLKNTPRVKPYRTKKGLSHFLDMYADDLSIFLEYKKNNPYENKINVKRVLQTMEIFRGWSGLKINLGKTYLTVFGVLTDKPKIIKELGINWCTEFKLLGIYFDST